MGKRVWSGREGEKFVFHYTEDHLADQIAEDEYFHVGPGAQFGAGLYATDLPPDDADDDEIRDVCFNGDATDTAFTGVLVLIADDPQTPFERVDEPRNYILPAERIGDLIPLHSLLVAIGRRNDAGDWEFEDWP